jgi:hypothetical protein
MYVCIKSRKFFFIQNKKYSLIDDFAARNSFAKPKESRHEGTGGVAPPFRLGRAGCGGGRSQRRKCEMKTAPYLLNYRTLCTQCVISLWRLSLLLSILSSRQ